MINIINNKFSFNLATATIDRNIFAGCIRYVTQQYHIHPESVEILEYFQNL